MVFLISLLFCCFIWTDINKNWTEAQEEIGKLSLNIAEIDILHEFFTSTQGENWNWLTDAQDLPMWTFNYSNQQNPCADDSHGFTNISTWQGIVCDFPPNFCYGSANCSISRIILAGYGLNGSIPESLGSLKHLQYLELGRNSLRGQIPRSMGELSSIKYLSCLVNSLTGTIPSQFGKLTQIEALSFLLNQLTGTIPSFIEKLRNLKALSLGFNQFSGSLPTFLGILTDLQFLSFRYNHITGSVPETFQYLQKMQFFTINNNLLTGSLSTSLGGMTSMKSISFRSNFFTGSIPTEFKKWLSLNIFDVSSNFFTGPLSDELFEGKCCINEVRMNNNQFSGNIPTSLLSISALRVLLFQENWFEGEINIRDPKNLNLLTIDASDNVLTGSVSSNLFLLPKLEQLVLTGNCFRGRLPSSLCSPTTLRTLYMGGLSSGTKCKFEWTSMTLSHQMEGSIADCIYQMNSLEALSFAGNGLYGSLVPRYASLKLTELSLSHNHIKGSIPINFLDPAMMYLDLSYNRIGNVISSYKANSTYHSTSLVLNINRLSGRIPESSKTASTINILEGNFFSFSTKSDLPQKDPRTDTAISGSSNLDYTNLGCACVIFLACLSIYFSRRIVQLNTSKVSVFSIPKLILFKHFDLIRLIKEFYGADSAVEHFVTVLKRLAIFCAIFSSIIFMLYSPFFKILKAINGGMFSTHTYGHSWLITGAMLSGVVPSILILLSWIILLSILCYFMFQIGVQSLRLLIIDRSSSSFRRDHSTMTHESSSLDRDSLSKNNRQRKRVNLFFVLTIILNTVLSSLIDGFYVYCIVSNLSNSVLLFIQVFVAILKTLLQTWFSYILSDKTFITNFGVILTISEKTVLLSYIFVMNDVLLPCITFMFADPTCLLNLFVHPADQKSAYTVQECLIYNGIDFTCNQYVDTPQMASYSVQFLYNFQCSSSILKALAPVLIIGYSGSCLRSLFIIGMLLFEFDFQKYFNRILQILLFPRLMRFADAYKTPQAIENSIKSNWISIVKPAEFFAVLFQHIIVSITFGVLVPYIAVVVGISALLFQFSFDYCLHYFISLRAKQDRLDVPLLKSIENSSSNIGKRTVLRVTNFIILVSSMIFGLFLFDIAADDDISFLEAALFLILSLIVGLTAICISNYMLNAHIRKGMMQQEDSPVSNNFETELFDNAENSNPIQTITQEPRFIEKMKNFEIQ